MAEEPLSHHDSSDGRKFGLTVGAALLAISASLQLWRHRPTAAALAGAWGALLFAAGVIAPRRLLPLERLWMGFGHLASRVTTPLVMGVVFFLVVTPIALAARLMGRRPLAHRAEDEGYWVRPLSGGRSDLTRQF